MGNVEKKLTKQEMLRNNFMEGMKLLSENGYTCYLKDESNYGFVITPNDNILYMQLNDNVFIGWEISFKYKPTTGCGDCCECVLENPKIKTLGLESGIYEIDLDIIQKMEQAGWNYASRLKANLYSSSDAWFNSYWNKDSLQKLI